MASGEVPELNFATGIDPAGAMWTEAQAMMEEGQATGNEELVRAGALKGVEAISLRLGGQSIDLYAQAFPGEPIPADPDVRHRILRAIDTEENDG